MVKWITLFLVLVFSSCQTTLPPNPHTLSTQSKTNSYDLATQSFYAGEYITALAYYQDYIRNNPRGPYVEESHFGLINCQKKMGNPNQVMNSVEQYLSKYPNGRFAGQIRQIQKEITGTQVKREKEIQTSKTLWQQEYEKSLQQLKQESNNPALLMKLGDLAWKLQLYKDSASYYEKALKLKPNLILDSTLQGRVEFDDSGKVFAKIPSGIVGSEESRMGIRIRNTHSYYRDEPLSGSGGTRYGKDYTGSGVQRVYVLTGTVINETVNVISNLQLEITTYTATREILDTQTISIGKLKPLQEKNFKFESKSFEFFNYPGVDHYEIKPIY